MCSAMVGVEQCFSSRERSLEASAVLAQGGSPAPGQAPGSMSQKVGSLEPGPVSSCNTHLPVSCHSGTFQGQGGEWSHLILQLSDTHPCHLPDLSPRTIQSLPSPPLCPWLGAPFQKAFPEGCSLFLCAFAPWSLGRSTCTSWGEAGGPLGAWRPSSPALADQTESVSAGLEH